MTTQEPALTQHEVRLFPSAHVSSDREAETRATASLLAVIRAVSEFGRTIVRAAGGPAGRLSCYTEGPYQLGSGGKNPPELLRPDGVIHADRGRTHWVAFVEVKVGRAGLDPVQVDKYHRLARQEGADAVITVSNQPALPDGRPPIALDGRRLRSIPVVHFSWERLLSEAQMLSRKKGVSDVDQKWILDEWIRYVDDPHSRIIEPPDLGPHWAAVLRAARTGSLDQAARELEDVARFWVDYVRKAALRLRAKLGVDVHVRLRRKEKQDGELHVQRLVAAALRNGALSGSLRVPDAAGDLRMELFLHSRCVRYGVEIAAPTRGRQITRVRWLARQLHSLDLPRELLVCVEWAARGLVTSIPAAQFVDDPAAVLIDRSGAPVARDVNPKRFVLHWTTRLGGGRGRSSAPVLEGISKGLEEFYRRVVEGLVRFVPPAPRLAPKDEDRDGTNGRDEDSGKAGVAPAPPSASPNVEVRPLLPRRVASPPLPE